MIQVGLTGSIGSGKSTVAKRFAELGAEVIDADRLAHQATEDPVVLSRIGEELGTDLVAGGRLDRKKTARRVFHDDEARRKLNAIVHPWVRRRSAEITAELQARSEPPDLVVHDVPLLFESGLDARFEATVAVVAPLETRVARVVGRGGMTEDEVLRRDAAQMPQEEKARRATYVIDNSGPPDALDDQVRRVWEDVVGGPPTHRPPPAQD